MTVQPPTWVAPSSRTPLPMGRRAKRAVLAQCQRCLVNGTAVVSGDRVLSMNLAANRQGSRLAHVDCGGSFALFDIEVGE